MQSLSLAQARRLALAAQGFARPRPLTTPTRHHLRRLFRQTGLLQIDSVNVLARAHYLPGWSRLGGYERAALDRMAYRDRELFEYWGHEASLLPTALHPLLRWRMRRAEQGQGMWGGVARLARERPEFVEHIYAQVRDRGPLTAGELTAGERRSTATWGWNWSDSKTALEFLFWSGRVATRERRNFERVYDVAERVIPPTVLAEPTPAAPDAHRALLAISARSLGVGTAGDLADYFRLRTPEARPRLDELVEAGELEPVAVEGWRQPAYVVAGVTVPRRVDAQALVVPFDPLIWERERTRRLFGFDYRVEIYVPAARRTHGYYVLPFLLDDRLVARIDLKSDRAAGVLRVQSAWSEPHSPAHTADALAAELGALAGWLDLGSVWVAPRGDLARALSAAVSASRVG